MKCFVLLTVLVFASKNENDAKSAETNLGEKIMENAENPILVKIEEDEYAKKKCKSSNYFGVSYNEYRQRWQAQRYGKINKNMSFNGCYRDEETAAHASDTLARKLMENGEQGHRLNFPENNTEVHPKEIQRHSKYFGVFYYEKRNKWTAQRWSKNEKKLLSNGVYQNEETAAHASDTLARKLMTNGEQNHELNFPDDNTEVYPEEQIKSSNYIGVYYSRNRWVAERWSKTEKKRSSYGSYKDEKTAAHASDTLAKKLMENDEQNLKLNFPDDNIEVYPKGRKTSSKYFGVYYNEKRNYWTAQRWSKNEKKLLCNGIYQNKETAAHASDTLARKLMANGKQNHKLNFPDDSTEAHPDERQSKRKRSFDFGNSQENENNFEKFEEKEK